MFERDKDDLRALGVPIEVGHLDAYFDDEPGYRVRADELQLPQIELTADEAQVVGLATKVWEHARLAEATTEAVRKLAAAGVPVDVGALDLVEPRLGADEPAFDVFWEAPRTGARWSSTTSARAARSPTRRIRALGRRPLLRSLVRRRPRPATAGEERVFRLSRVHGERPAGGASRGAYDVPAGARHPRGDPAVRPARSRRAGHAAGAHRQRPRASAARPRRSRPAVPGPDDDDRLGPRRCSSGAGSDLADGGARPRPRRGRRGAGRAARRGRRPADRAGRPGAARERPARGAREQVAPAADAGALPPQPRRGEHRTRLRRRSARRRPRSSRTSRCSSCAGCPDGYPDDLIDVDLDALEGDEGVIRVSNADYLARPLRLTATEATAVMVALLALRGGAQPETREIVDRALAKLQAATADAGVVPIDPGIEPEPTDLTRLRDDLEHAVRDGRQVRLTYWVPARDEETERVVDPRRCGHVAWRHLPRRVVPQRRGRPALPARPDPRRDRARRPVTHAERPPRTSAATSSTSTSRPSGSRCGSPPRPAGWSSTTRSRRPARCPTAASRSTCSWRTDAGSSGCCCGSRRTRAWCGRRTGPTSSPRAQTTPSGLYEGGEYSSGH